MDAKHKQAAMQAIVEQQQVARLANAMQLQAATRWQQQTKLTTASNLPEVQSHTNIQQLRGCRADSAISTSNVQGCSSQGPLLKRHFTATSKKVALHTLCCNKGNGRLSRMPWPVCR
jgi:predicted signal transduction protein with EAL and GGDEF domain